MSPFRNSLATSQIRLMSSSLRTASGTLSHSHLALTLIERHRQTQKKRSSLNMAAMRRGRRPDFLSARKDGNLHTRANSRTWGCKRSACGGGRHIEDKQVWVGVVSGGNRVNSQIMHEVGDKLNAVKWHRHCEITSPTML